LSGHLAQKLKSIFLKFLDAEKHLKHCSLMMTKVSQIPTTFGRSSEIELVLRKENFIFNGFLLASLE